MSDIMWPDVEQKTAGVVTQSITTASVVAVFGTSLSPQIEQYSSLGSTVAKDTSELYWTSFVVLCA